jgi:hypothetical protein
MTEVGVEKYLSHKDYIIQIWTTGKVRPGTYTIKVLQS